MDITHVIVLLVCVGIACTSIGWYVGARVMPPVFWNTCNTAWNPAVTRNPSIAFTEWPKTIYQTYISADHVPPYIFGAIEQFAPGWNYKFFNDNECVEFLDRFYGDRMLAKYKSIPGMAHRADLFRYCILYMFGGCYLDIKTTLIRPLDSVFTQRGMCYTVLSLMPNSVYQGIMCVTPKHPLVADLISNAMVSDTTVNYHVYTSQMYCLLGQYTGKTALEPGPHNAEPTPWELFEEKNDGIMCMGGVPRDRYGTCSRVYSSNGQIMFHTPDSTFPWNK